jgi:hypothetical protein
MKPAGSQWIRLPALKIKVPTTGNISRAKYCRPRWAKSAANLMWHAVAALP